MSLTSDVTGIRQCWSFDGEVLMGGALNEEEEEEVGGGGGGGNCQSQLISISAGVTTQSEEIFHERDQWFGAELNRRRVGAGGESCG